MISADDGRHSPDSNQPPGPTGNDPDKTRITPPGETRKQPQQTGSVTPKKSSVSPQEANRERQMQPPPSPGGTPRKPLRKPPVDATQLPPRETPKKQPPSQGITPPQQPADRQSDGTRIVSEPPASALGSRPPNQPPKQPPTPPEGKGSDGGDDEIDRLRRALSGKYEISRKLGAGGMANVYLAREIALEREVAIKVLPQSFLRDKLWGYPLTARAASGVKVA